jgi:glycogen operon protein
MRSFWLQRATPLGTFAQHFAGSSNVFQHHGRQPTASVNFITAHDGFTLRDLVSYNAKHNEANGEQNRDGHGDNHSWNGGVEGETEDVSILQLRGRLQRAMLATLLFSQGTPMLLAGDEIGHTQHGNNNAYCQDNAVCWLDWQQADQSLLKTTRTLLTLRRRYPALRHARWHAQSDVAWSKPDGTPLEGQQWDAYGALAIRLTGVPACLLLVNVQTEPVDFVLPAGAWHAVFNSTGDASTTASSNIAAHSITLFVDQQESNATSNNGDT